MDDVVSLYMEAQDHNYGIFTTEDFNLSLGVGQRGDIIQDLDSQFSIQIANHHDLDDDNPNHWTFRSSMDDLRRIDFTLHSASLKYIDAETMDSLDLVSDHRAVHTQFEHIGPYPRNSRYRKKSINRWKSYLNGHNMASIHHMVLQSRLARMDSTMPFGNITSALTTAASIGGLPNDSRNNYTRFEKSERLQ